MKIILSFCLFFSCLFLFSTELYSQAINTKGDYIVDFAPFSPPEQDIMREMINKPAMNFMASDQDGTSHTLSAKKGENVILAFWSIGSLETPKLLTYLNSLVTEDNLTILSYGYESRAEIEEYLASKIVDFPVLSQGKFISEVGYGHDLGAPRLFFIDKNGIIKDILPASAFLGGQDLYPSILNIVEKAY